jgi:hypothetical protein
MPEVWSGRPHPRRPQLLQVPGSTVPQWRNRLVLSWARLRSAFVTSWCCSSRARPRPTVRHVHWLLSSAWVAVEDELRRHRLGRHRALRATIDLQAELTLGLRGCHLRSMMTCPSSQNRRGRCRSRGRTRDKGKGKSGRLRARPHRLLGPKASLRSGPLVRGPIEHLSGDSARLL